MGDLSYTMTAMFKHHVELYTARFFIDGNIEGAFKRVSDLLNRRESNYLPVLQAAITPLGQTTESKRFDMPISIGRLHVHFAAPIEETATSQGAASAPGREFYVQKSSQPCYVLTDTFVIHGQCYLHQETTLQNLLDRPDMLFIPISDATIYLVARPNLAWKRNLVLVDKEKIEVVYLTEQPEVKE